MKGLEKNWTVLTSSEVVNFRSLSAGACWSAATGERSVGEAVNRRKRWGGIGEATSMMKCVGVQDMTPEEQQRNGMRQVDDDEARRTRLRAVGHTAPVDPDC